MGKKTGKSKSSGGGGGGGGGFSTLDVDPRRVRYAHSKIKPLFSGCGRTIEQTLCEIRDGETRAADLPMITVLLGPLDPSDGQQWFFSLNNRRLFVFKACREEGLLGPRGLVRVRVRTMKAHEHERYTLDRCSVQAKFLFAPKPLKPLKPPAVATAPLPLLPPTSTGEVEAGTSPAAAAAAAAAMEGHDNPTEEEGEEEGLGCRPAQKHEEVELVDGTRKAEAPRKKEHKSGGRGVFDTPSVTVQRDGQEEDENHGHETWSPRSGGDRSRVASDSRRAAADDATQETEVNASVRGKKNRRRKGKGKGGADREGAGASG